MSFKNLILTASALSLAALTGCDGISGGAGICYENGQVVVCTDVGTTPVGGYEGDDIVVIEWSSDWEVYDLSIICTFETEQGESVQTGDVYLDSVGATIVFYGVSSHFDAECVGDVDYGSGPQQSLFCDESPEGEVTSVTWEDEAVQSYRARNCELDIDND